MINQLNQSTGARIKLSQNQDFFPMTDDRIIGISGSLESIAVAIGELITKIIEVSDFIIERSFTISNSLIFMPLRLVKFAGKDRSPSLLSFYAIARRNTLTAITKIASYHREQSRHTIHRIICTFKILVIALNHFSRNPCPHSTSHYLKGA